MEELRSALDGGNSSVLYAVRPCTVQRVQPGRMLATGPGSDGPRVQQLPRRQWRHGGTGKKEVRAWVPSHTYSTPRVASSEQSHEGNRFCMLLGDFKLQGTALQGIATLGAAVSSPQNHTSVPRIRTSPWQLTRFQVDS